MTATLPMQRVAPLSGHERIVYPFDFDLGWLGAEYAPAAHNDINSVMSVIMHALVRTKGPKRALEFVHGRTLDARILAVPRGTAESTVMQYGATEYTIDVSHAGGRLAVAASRAGGQTSAIIFNARQVPAAKGAPRDGSGESTVWTPFSANIDGTEVLTGRYGRWDQEKTQLGRETLLSATATLGDLATAMNTALQLDGRLDPQVSAFTRTVM